MNNSHEELDRKSYRLVTSSGPVARTLVTAYPSACASPQYQGQTQATKPAKTCAMKQGWADVACVLGEGLGRVSKVEGYGRPICVQGRCDRFAGLMW